MLKVSVIMACHNAERFIGEAIDSVLCQTYKNLELIIVDDASTDNSLAIARQASSLDPRIYVYTLDKNVGPGGARNIGVEKASGEWLAVLDADDVFVENKLEKQLERLNGNNSDIVLIGSNSYQIDVSSNIISEQKYPLTNEKLKNNLVWGKRFPAHSSIMYRTDIIRFLGAFDNRFSPSEDWDLWLRLINEGDFTIAPEPLVKYRNHALNISKITPEREKYGYAAMICHWLRIWGYSDPSKYTNSKDWDAFLNWISSKLREEGIFEYIQTITIWRNLLKEKLTLTAKCWEAGRMGIMNPRISILLIRSKLFHDTLPKKLAKEWIKKSSVLSHT